MTRKEVRDPLNGKVLTEITTSGEMGPIAYGWYRSSRSRLDAAQHQRQLLRSVARHVSRPRNVATTDNSPRCCCPRPASFVKPAAVDTTAIATVSCNARLGRASHQRQHGDSLAVPSANPRNGREGDPTTARHQLRRAGGEGGASVHRLHGDGTFRAFDAMTVRACPRVPLRCRGARSSTSAKANSTCGRRPR